MDRTKGLAQGGRGVLFAPVLQAMGLVAEWGRRRPIRKAHGLTSEVFLRDIGLTPDDLVEALAQPLDMDASDGLVRAAVERTGNW